MTTNMNAASFVVGGAIVRATMFNPDNIVFVDGDYGSADNVGLGDPQQATTSITAALAKITGQRGGVIFVRPRSTAAGAQTYYTDNVTLPLTKPGIQIYGCGDPENPYYGVDIKATTATSAVFTVNGPAMLIEGMRLAGTGQTTASVIDAQDNGSTRIIAGLTVRKNVIGNAKGKSAATAGIYLNSSWYVKVEDNIFTDNQCSIAVLTNSGGQSLGPIIRRNTFIGKAANRDVDIYISQGGSTGSYGCLIHGNVFPDNVPSGLSGATISRYIYWVNEGTGMISGNYFGCLAGPTTLTELTFGVSGTAVTCPAGIRVVGNYGVADSATGSEGLIGELSAA